METKNLREAKGPHGPSAPPRQVGRPRSGHKWADLVRPAAAWILLSVMLGTWVARAQEVSVPVNVQVALVDKVAAYDKNFAARAGDRTHVLIWTVRGDPDSERMGSQLKAALGQVERIGGVPHEDSVVEYRDPPSLVSACREQHASIAFLTPGMAREIEAIAKALEGVSILTVGSIGGYASRGAVIDFFAEGGKPKIGFNLAQARKQQIAFAPEVIRIMRVVE